MRTEAWENPWKFWFMQERFWEKDHSKMQDVKSHDIDSSLDGQNLIWIRELVEFTSPHHV